MTLLQTQAYPNLPWETRTPYLSFGRDPHLWAFPRRSLQNVEHQQPEDHHQHPGGVGEDRLTRQAGVRLGGIFPEDDEMIREACGRLYIEGEA